MVARESRGTYSMCERMFVAGPRKWHASGRDLDFCLPSQDQRAPKLLTTHDRARLQISVRCQQGIKREWCIIAAQPHCQISSVHEVPKAWVRVPRARQRHKLGLYASREKRF